MKKVIILAFTALMGLQCGTAMAQRSHHDERRHEPRPKISELVGDLSSGQKRKLETLTSESRERVDKLRKEQKAVRDSIERYMDMEGDQSRALYPLFDREARLQTEVNREMYATKVRIDEVLSPEQRKELKAAGKRHHQNKKAK